MARAVNIVFGNELKDAEFFFTMTDAVVLNACCRLMGVQSRNLTHCYNLYATLFFTIRSENAICLHKQINSFQKVESD